MPNRWSPGCKCCGGCHSCDGSAITGVSVVVSGLPSSVVIEFSTGNTTTEETWQGLDNANGTWNFPLKADPNDASAPECFVDASQLCGGFTVTKVFTDPFGSTSTVQNGFLYITPFGNLRSTNVPGVVGVPINPGSVNPFVCNLLRFLQDSRGFSDDVCIDMGADTASGSSCALKRKVVTTSSPSAGGRFCVTSPTGLIGDSVQCDYTF